MSLTKSIVAVVAGLALGAPASALATPPRSFPVPGGADAVAYSTGRVLWAEHVGWGPVIVREARFTGGPPGSLAAIARPGARDDDEVEVSLAAGPSGFLLGVRDRAGDRIVMGGGGAPARTLLACPPPPRGRHAPAALTVVAGTAGFAFA